MFYLDNILILGNNRHCAGDKAQHALALLTKLGFTLNEEKTDLNPRQNFVYLGLQWDTCAMSVCLPQDKTQEIRALAATLQARAVTRVRFLLTFLGKVNFAAYALPLSRLHVRELHHTLRSVYKRPSDISKLVSLPQVVKRDIIF